MRRIAMIATICFALAGCGGAEAASAQKKVDPAVATAAADACAAHCERLRQQTGACPGIVLTPPDLFIGASLDPGGAATCSFDMAGGFEALDAVRTAIEDVDPGVADDLPDLAAALDKASAAHDLYADRCTLVGTMPQYDQPADVRDCSEAVRESIRWLPIVARELKAAAG